MLILIDLLINSVWCTSSDLEAVSELDCHALVLAASMPPSQCKTICTGLLENTTMFSVTEIFAHPSFMSNDCQTSKEMVRDQKYTSSYSQCGIFLAMQAIN